MNRARFSGSAPEGNYIPGAPDAVVSAGIAVDHYGPWSGALFITYIGSYPLIEDNSARSDSSTVFDAQVGYEIAPKTKLRLDVFNIFNKQTNDITYYYTSRLPGEPPEGSTMCTFTRARSEAFGSRWRIRSDATSEQRYQRA